jgi:hypothetical protein
LLISGISYLLIFELVVTEAKESKTVDEGELLYILFFFFFFAVMGFELWAYTSSHSTSAFL